MMTVPETSAPKAGVAKVKKEMKIAASLVAARKCIVRLLLRRRFKRAAAIQHTAIVTEAKR
jgi:hypothetical protein